MAILEVRDLTKVYGKNNTVVTAVDHMSFTVEKGEFIAIVGASGSGKSTLINLIGGIDHPSSGDVIIDGKSLQEMSENERTIFRRRNIGMIYQFYNLVATLTAQENIMLPRLLDQQGDDQDKIETMLKRIGLLDRATHYPNELSGGQQQRVSVGRAMINNPAIILADEPTGNLDSKTSQDIMGLLKLANRKYGQTLLLITHDEKIALQADRMMTIRDGQIIGDEVMKA